MIDSINNILFLLGRRDKKFLFGLMIFSILIAFIEMLGVAIIMPFISIASDNSLIHSNYYYNYSYKLLSFQEEKDYVIFFGILLIIFYIFRGFANLLYSYALARFTFGRYFIFTVKLLTNYIGMPYKDFLDKNSSELTKAIVNEAHNLTTMMSSFLLMMSELLVLIMIFSIMVYFDWIVTLSISMFLMLNGWFMVRVISNRIKKEGVVRELYQKEFYEIINSTFGNFKIIKLLSNDKKIIDHFKFVSSKFAFSNIINHTLNHVPRLLIETISFLIVITMIIYLIYKNDGDVSRSIALISIFILGLYRLMPSVNRIMSSYNIILYNHRALDIVYSDTSMAVEKLSDDNLPFNDKIHLKNISFEYIAGEKILDDINIDILKGDKIAFIGESGSGKSTLVDIITGLNLPTNGSVFVDGVELAESRLKSLRNKVGYIPQNIYLFDGTVAENVAFSGEYDESRVLEVLSQANILSFLEGTKNGIQTRVGEGGIKLSGGQKQRIAIARALYSDPEILVLDEATSALDDKVEKEIMDEVYTLSTDKTLIIIAHRLSTIKYCEKIYKVDKKKLSIMINI
jgi:ATP-binding cassette, subfamily B, bacterial PglK